MVLHQLEKCLDRFRSEVFAFAKQGVSLINEQNAVERATGDLLCLESRMANVAADETGTIDLNQMPFCQHAERSISTSEQTRNSGFARAGVAGEYEMKRQGLSGEFVAFAELADAQQIRDVEEILLNGFKAHETHQF